MMLGMAGTAIQIQTAELHHAVKAGRVFQLGGDIGVTGKAPVGHGVYFPGSGMTGAALLDLGVGVDVPKRIPTDGAQAAGRKQFPAAGKSCAGDGCQGDDCDQHSREGGQPGLN